MQDTGATATAARSIQPGTVVCDADGNTLGVVQGFTADGVTVRLTETSGSRPHAIDRSDDGAADVGDESGDSGGADPGDVGRGGEHRPGHAVGEGYLMWRCGECGAMGDLATGMPDSCPGCTAQRTALFRSRED